MVMKKIYRLSICIFFITAAILAPLTIYVSRTIADEVSFGTAINYPVENSPWSVTSGDFDGDRIADIAVTLTYRDSISILFNNGDGTFKPAVNYTVGTWPYSIIAEDFDGDGDTDLATTNSRSDDITILLNDGRGFFPDKSTYGVGDMPYSITAGDLDGDNDLDLAVANQLSNDITILFNNGFGSFTNGGNYFLGADAEPYSIITGHFDWDSDLDLAVANGYFCNVSILLNNGDGTFFISGSYGDDCVPFSIAAGDFNRDGYTDLATANWGYDNITVLFGNWDGSFGSSVNYDAGGDPFSVTSADFDSDSDLDLAVSNEDSKYISIFLNNGDGTFAEVRNYYIGGHWAQAIISDDFNEDGKLDLAAAKYGSSEISILFGRGNGTFSAFLTYDVVGYVSYAYEITSSDFNEDGEIDLVAANSESDNVSIFTGQGDGTFAAAVNYATGDAPYSVEASDFNKDGDIDLAVANLGSDNISILLGQGDGTFAAAVNYATGDAPYSVEASDFNKDGDIDLAVANSGSNNISILSGQGDGTFAAAVNYATGDAPHFVEASDFNKDGDIDLAIANSGSNNISILSGQGDGTFSAAVNYATGEKPCSIKAVDFNGDSETDLAVVNEVSSTISILLGQAGGTFSAAVNYIVEINPSDLTVADFNGDGKTDLIVANHSSSNISILLGHGDGIFSQAVRFDLRGEPWSVTSADFDHDGRTDLALTDVYGVIILINTTYSVFNVYPGESIQAAIDAAHNWDVIIIHTGTYKENINFLGKQITVRTSDPTNPAIVDTTIIDGSNNGTVVTFNSGEGINAILNGLVLQNGNNSDTGGGGIYCQSSSPSIINCTIRYNHAIEGGGIKCIDSSPTIMNCVFHHNEASQGGALYCMNSPIKLTNCTASLNFATAFGAEQGDGMWCSGPLLPTITNCIFWDNSPDEISGPTLAVSYSDIEGGYAGTNNIDANPQFLLIDPNAIMFDFRLDCGSPCINAGTSEGAPDKDKEGWPRPNGNNYDIGAYETDVTSPIGNCILSRDSVPVGHELCLNPQITDDRELVIELLPGTPWATTDLCSVINYEGAYTINAKISDTARCSGSFGCTFDIFGYPSDADLDSDDYTTDDCDYLNASINPGATEICDGIDNNCNGIIDEEGASGCTVYFRDEDDDGHGIDRDSQCLCAAVSPYTAIQGGDFDDSDFNTHVDAVEICDGIDNDGDGLIDEENASGCTVYHRDEDGDTYGIDGDTRCLCAAESIYTAERGWDCNDGDDDVYLNAPEVCDGKDNDCDSDFDEGYTNNDGDRYGDVCDNCPDVANDDQENSDGDHYGNVCDNCPNDSDNDTDGDGVCGDVDNCPNIPNPGQEDSDGIDDGDGIGDACESCTDGTFTVTKITDNAYDDRNTQINTSGDVVWDGYDGNDYEIYLYSDGNITQITDNSFYDLLPQINADRDVVWYGFDGNDNEIYLYSNGDIIQISDNAYSDYNPQINADGDVVWYGFDGNDSEIYLYSDGNIIQITDNTFSDVGPQINASGFVVWYGNDGSDNEIYLYYDGNITQISDNSYNDWGPQINAGGIVVWRGFDGNDFEIYLYYDGNITRITDNSYDDSVPQINTAGDVVWLGSDGSDAEIYLYSDGNIIQISDNTYSDWSPQINAAGDVVWYGNDSYDREIYLYSSGNMIQITDNAFYDNSPQINAAGDVVWYGSDGSDFEIFIARIDSDCDGVLDSEDNCKRVYNPYQADSDGDEIGDVCDFDSDGDGYFAIAAGGDDCNDTDPNTYPGASEQCDGKDNDCDLVIPEDELDKDADGVMACSGDCDDTDPNTYPGAPEQCDGKDNDCDLVIPEDELDKDADGVMACSGDCDDTDPNTYPGAPEQCDGKDNDCDVIIDEGFPNIDADLYADCVDSCPFDPDNDTDGDGICGDIDNCPNIPNPSQEDSDGIDDGDDIGDACESCTDGTFTVNRITDNTYSDWEPQINTSGDVVWYGFDGNDTEIYLYSDGNIIQITDNAFNDSAPQINATWDVVWNGYDGNDFEIYLYSDGNITQITNNAYDDWHPQINEGGNVVWDVFDGNDREIYLYSDGNITQITDNAFFDVDAHINATGIVAWRCSDGNDYEICLYSDGNITRITNNAFHDSIPQINASGDVVWDGYDGNDLEIYLYSDGNITQITNNAYEDFRSQINAGGDVVWIGDYDQEIYLYSDGNMIQITDNAYEDSLPQINQDGIVVWYGFDGNDTEIYLYFNGNITQITDNALPDSLPQINVDGIVVWSGDDGNDYEIYISSRDSDCDGIADFEDNCVRDHNPYQTDSDGDEIGDVCDPDSDGDTYDAVDFGGDDCDDTDPNVNPGAIELPYNGKDDDCNPLTSDIAGIRITPISGLITTESGGTATVHVRLETAPSDDVTFGLSSTDLTEGAVLPEDLLFTTSNWYIPKVVTITGVDDLIIDGDVAYTIVTGPAVSMDVHYNGLNGDYAYVTNQDNEGIIIDPPGLLLTTEAGNTDTFTVILNTAPSDNVTFTLSSSDPTEGTVSPTSLTFTPSDYDTPQTVTITGMNDDLDDDDILYTIITAPATSGDTNYDGADPIDVAVTNADNDIADIIIIPTSGLITAEDGSTDTFTVVLSSQPTHDVIIGLLSSDLSEGTISPTGLTFTPLGWSTPQTVTITGVRDFTDDGPVPYTIIIAPAISEDSNYHGLNPEDVSVTNYTTLDDEDSDSVPNEGDNCLYVSNPDQNDSNVDGEGDACDDTDGDGILDNEDKCLLDPSVSQDDIDGDGIGDDCDDTDHDGVFDGDDPCPFEHQDDRDGDGICGCEDEYVDCNTLVMAFDNCPGNYNPDQDANICVNGGGTSGIPPAHKKKPTIDDTDMDGIPDREDLHPNDSDNDLDGILDGSDNCYEVANPSQADRDYDGIGDLCDDDNDNDGVPDETDNCPEVANASQANTDDDGEGDACDPDIDGDGLSNDYELMVQGLDHLNEDSDSDGVDDGSDSDPLCNDATGGCYYIILFDNNEDGDIDEKFASWLPADGNQLIIPARLRAPNGSYVDFPTTSTVTFRLSPSQIPGVAINDDTEVCDKTCSNDYSFDQDNKEVLLRALPGGASVVSVNLYSFDYGGWTDIQVSTTDPAGNEISITIRFPLDHDMDLLPTAWEVLHGLNPYRQHSVDEELVEKYGDNPSYDEKVRNKIDSDVDHDISLDNEYMGDGIINFDAYRGVLISNPIHIRLNPRKKDLFVYGHGFSNSVDAPTTVPGGDPNHIMPFLLLDPDDFTFQNAFEEAHIAVHDLTGMSLFADINYDPPKIDILRMHNITDTPITIMGECDGMPDHTGHREWKWDCLAASVVGDSDSYSANDYTALTGTYSYHLNQMHYLYNKPYIDDLNLNPDYIGRLDPCNIVEDYRNENGIGPEAFKGKTEDRFNVNKELDGDRKMLDWKDVVWDDLTGKPVDTNSVDTDLIYDVGYHFSVFDFNGNGNPENPPVCERQGSITDPAEYTPEKVMININIHEMGHGTGIKDHTADLTCIMCEKSHNWDRAGHFSPLARSFILIHNR
jgi:hypothetical protein